MQISDFSTNKLFVLIKQPNDVRDFTDNPSGKNSYRTAADASGVLVFLEPIHRIYTHGSYYGVSSEDWTELVNTVNGLDKAVTSVIESLGTLETTVANHGKDIVAIGNLPYTDENDQQVAGTGWLNDIATQISLINTKIEALDPNGEIGDIETAISDAVDSKLTTALADYVKLSDYNAAMAAKVEKSEFNTFTTSTTNKLNELEGQQSTNTNAITALQQAVSAVPKFGIKIVDALPKLHPTTTQEGVEIEDTSAWNIYDEKSNPNGFQTTVIYLIRRDSSAESGDKEIFTEYICVEDTSSTSNKYSWEKLGSQFFTINNYYTSEQVNKAIEDAIKTAVGTALEDGDIAEGSNWYTTLKSGIQTNKDNIAANQSAIQELQNFIYTLDENQQKVLNFTGEDIKTTATGSTTIAEDIASLNQRIEWQIIDSSENPEEQTEP